MHFSPFFGTRIVFFQKNIRFEIKLEKRMFKSAYEVKKIVAAYLKSKDEWLFLTLEYLFFVLEILNVVPLQQ